MKKIIDKLFENRDLKYREFTSSLIPNINIDNIIGVRIPVIRKIAKVLSFEDKRLFLKELPHKYLEENILHSVLINQIMDFDECINELENFLDYVDNWSVCDTLSCKILCDDYDKFFNFLKSCLDSNSVYKVRFAFVMMMKYFIKTKYVDQCNSIACNFVCNEYYVNMAIAWYFSYALIFEYNKTVKIFENRNLNRFVHNKSIQKAIESYRISNDKKDYLKTLRIK